MEPDQHQQAALLHRLAEELSTRGYPSQPARHAGQPGLMVTNPDSPALSERVLCRPADDGSWWFWWPWQQRIGPAADLGAVSAKITTVLRSVGEPP